MTAAAWSSILLNILLLATQLGGVALPADAGIPMLVNRTHTLTKEWVPPVLALPQVAPSSADKAEAIYMAPEAAEALEALFEAAEQAGFKLYAVSGYRKYALQASIYRNKVSTVGESRARLLVAPAGASEHQTGLAMDINGTTTLSQGLVSAFGNSPEGRWVAEQAHRFGFVVRYPKDATAITGYSWEPWHLRYVGVEHATAMAVLDITLEEYTALLTLRQRMVRSAPEVQRLLSAVLD